MVYYNYKREQKKKGKGKENVSTYEKRKWLFKIHRYRI